MGPRWSNMPQHGPNILPTCALQRPNIEHVVRKSSQAFFNLASQILFGACKLVPLMPSTSSAWKFCCAAFSLSDKTRLWCLVTGGKTPGTTRTLFNAALQVVLCDFQPNIGEGWRLQIANRHGSVNLAEAKLPIAWWTHPMQRTPQRIKQKTEGPRILKTSRTWFEDISRTLTNSRPKQSHREPNESRKAGLTPFRISYTVTVFFKTAYANIIICSFTCHYLGLTKCGFSTQLENSTAPGSCNADLLLV